LLLRWGLANLFCLGHPETVILSISASHMEWGDRYTLLCLAIGCDGV
jgi:hypothetical protein